MHKAHRRSYASFHLVLIDSLGGAHGSVFTNGVWTWYIFTRVGVVFVLLRRPSARCAFEVDLNHACIASLGPYARLRAWVAEISHVESRRFWGDLRLLPLSRCVARGRFSVAVSPSVCFVPVPRHGHGHVISTCRRCLGLKAAEPRRESETLWH